MIQPLPNPQTEFQRLAMEQALLLAREMESVAERAPDGQVISQLEKLMLTRGRENHLQLLKAKFQHTADEAVKKGGLHGRVRADNRDVTKDLHRETS